MMRDDMKASKGLEFPVVTLPGVGHMSAKDKDEGALCDGVAGYAAVGDWDGWKWVCIKIDQKMSGNMAIQQFN